MPHRSAIVAPVDWTEVMSELLGFMGKRVSLTVSVGDQPITAMIYGSLQAGPEIKEDVFYLYVDTAGSGVQVPVARLKGATWVDGPLGRTLSIGFDDTVLTVKEVPSASLGTEPEST